MRKSFWSWLLVRAFLTANFLPLTASAQSAPQPIHNTVLVHGAWTDGSSWSKVIPMLEAKGLHVAAVQNPLTSFAADVAATKRVIDAQDGSVLLVGLSYGRAVITEAGNTPQVADLVYVAAFAPDAGEQECNTAKRMNACTLSLPSSRVPMPCQARKVAVFLEQAASGSNTPTPPAK